MTTYLIPRQSTFVSTRLSACLPVSLSARYFCAVRLFFSELFERIADVCEAYVLDSPSRGRDWLAELAGVDVTLRSQCSAVVQFINVG